MSMLSGCIPFDVLFFVGFAHWTFGQCSAIIQLNTVLYLCEAGVNIKVMQDTLGHADISTTLNIYTDVTKELKKGEFAGLDAYFKGEVKKAEAAY